MAVSTLVEVLGENFAKYMEAFKPFLIVGLKNVAEYQVTILESKQWALHKEITDYGIKFTPKDKSRITLL